MKKVGVWDERLVGRKNMVTNHGAGDSVGGGGSNIAASVGYGLGQPVGGGGGNIVLPGEKFIA